MQGLASHLQRLTAGEQRVGLPSSIGPCRDFMRIGGLDSFWIEGNKMPFGAYGIRRWFWD